MKIRMAVAIVLGCALSCAAAKQEIKSETKPQTAQPAQALSSEEVINKLKEWDKKLDSLQAGFEQTVTFEETGMKTRIEGKLQYLKPNNLRVEHSKPQKQVVYTDKKNIWIYKPDDAQAVKAVWNDWIKQQSGTFSGLTDFGDYAKVIEKHKITVKQPKNSPEIELVMSPKENPKLYTLTMVLSKTDFFPVGIRLKIDKTAVDTRLVDIRKNETIAAAVFEFKAPEGVSVIEFSKKTK